MKGEVLITGGAGFIGSRVAIDLLSRGYPVTILDNFSPQIHGGNTELPAGLRDDAKLLRGDVRDPEIWPKALSSCETVVHLAAETGTGQSMYEVARYEQVNIAGTAHLYQALISNSNAHVERIVVASSRAIYGEGAYRCGAHGTVYPESRSNSDKLAGNFEPLCPVCCGKCISVATSEEAPLKPSSFYGLTKQVQEQLTLMFGQAMGIASFALRYQNVYGPGQSLNNPYTGILAVFSTLARAGKDINVFEDGLESRDFVYIDDVVRATSACVESSLIGTHVCNVGSNERTTVMQVASAVNKFFGCRSNVRVTGNFRMGDIRHGLADLSRAGMLLGFSPAWKFQDGLRKFLEWANEREPIGSTYDQSLQEMQRHGLLHGR
ncbi:NAD-dependent epimerase/dehydratase family protein [Occallatibacter savannae]|uniref:NAD-dependent epimerase/dehydratase family protein n=1 Tax=Occallatibacter savannae TaxID=1002691 RepID=UPI000D69838A|nr:NAD-dependent epimerase/dehydratase family protein [Occallatibacter savannae]